MKRLLLLVILLCVNFDTVLNAQTGTYRIKRGGAGFNLPAPEGYIPVGVGGTSWVLAETDCVLDTVPDPPTFTCSGSGALYSTIQNEGTDLTQRNKLNFIGALVNCADDAGNARTNCTFTTTTHALLDGGTVVTDTTNSAVTRGDLIIGNSTPAWDDLAIGAAHTVLTSDGTDPSWQTSIPVPSILDPTKGTFAWDDFTAHSDGNITGTRVSDLAWLASINSGSIINGSVMDNVTSAPPNSERHPGVTRLTTAAGASGRAAISLGGATTATGTYTATNGVLLCEFLFQMYDLSSATQRFRIHLGMSNDWASNTLSGDAGFWIEYSDNVNSGKFEYKYFAAGATVTVDSGVTAVADTWYRIRFVTNADWSEVTYTINGAASSTFGGVTTNDFTVNDSMSPGAKIVKSVGTTQRELIIDYFRLYQVFTTPRE